MKKETRASVESKVREAMSYAAYRDLVARLLAENKTTGPNQSEAMIHYTQMNDHRMNRWDKKVELLPELTSAVDGLKGSYTWLVITEGWCGDAAHIVPVINKIAEASDKIDLKLILRDENLDLMDRHLTNGGRSIPKVILLDHDLNEVGEWGPRPQPVQQMFLENRALPEPVPYREFSKQMQLWYSRDKSETIQTEFLDLIQNLETVPA